MSTFQDLGLIKPLLAAIEKQGYQNPTPIQVQAMPVILQHRDLFATAPTGTGKTAAFAIPILQSIIQNPQKKTHALILAPTRELAHQISDNFKKYANGTNLKMALVYGGVSQMRQVDEIRRNPQIIIATPGRLLDLIEQGYIDLSAIQTFVLDECDRMLDMGFINDIREIGNLIKTENLQTLLFSATASSEIRRLAADMLKDPASIDIAPENHQKPKIIQQVYPVDKSNKYKLLKDILESWEVDSMLIFTKTKHGADRLVNYLNKDNFFSVAIHGDKSQRERTKNLELFKRGKAQLLVATDVAARGVDIKELNYVLNYDMALDTDTHTHRIGRTGRAGAEGTAISFCDDQEARFLRDILKEHGQDSMTMMNHDYFIEIPWQKHPRRNESSGRSSNSRFSNRGSNEGRQFENRKFDNKNTDSRGSENRSADNKSSDRSYNKSNRPNRFGDHQGFGKNKSERNNREFRGTEMNQLSKPKNYDKNFDQVEFIIMDELTKERSSERPSNSNPKFNSGNRFGDRSRNERDNSRGSRGAFGGNRNSDSRPSRGNNGGQNLDPAARNEVFGKPRRNENAGGFGRNTNSEGGRGRDANGTRGFGASSSSDRPKRNYGGGNSFGGQSSFGGNSNGGNKRRKNPAGHKNKFKASSF
jgi:ATP-dependent RNA helicase RhlE